MRSPWVQICSTMVPRSPCDTRSSSTEWEVRDMASEQSARVRDASLSESTVEDVALDWLASLGWAVAHGPDIAPDTPAAERADYGTVVLTNRLRSALARELREENARGEELGLSEDELAFYDALETNDSAVQVLGNETLRSIARELVETVRGNVTIDWTLRENVRANLRRLVKRTLRRHGYPPDKQEKATRTVLEQAEVLSADWAA